MLADEGFTTVLVQAEVTLKVQQAQVLNLKTQGSYLLDQHRAKIASLQQQLDAAAKSVADKDAEVAQMAADMAAVWQYAVALNHILCRLEGGHYPATDTSGLR